VVQGRDRWRRSRIKTLLAISRCDCGPDEELEAMETLVERWRKRILVLSMVETVRFARSNRPLAPAGTPVSPSRPVFDQSHLAWVEGAPMALIDGHLTAPRVWIEHAHCYPDRTYHFVDACTTPPRQSDSKGTLILRFLSPRSSHGGFAWPFAGCRALSQRSFIIHSTNGAPHSAVDGGGHPASSNGIALK
jgi:hypothetical protein